MNSLRRRDSLSIFSESVLALGRMSRHEPANAFLHKAVELLGSELGFSSAWWGLGVDQGDGQMADIQQAEAMGLPSSVVKDWREISKDDEFARVLTQNPGKVQLVASVSCVNNWPSRVMDFATRHGIQHCMALCLDDTSSGQMFFIAAYRQAGDLPFSTTDAALFEELVRHTVQLWHFSLRDSLSRSSEEGIGRIAIANKDGHLAYVGAQFCEVLCGHWSEWDGVTLPEEVVKRLAHAPSTVRLGKKTITIQSHGDFFQLVAESPTESKSQLSLRERRVAHLFAEGMSYKEIAKKLDLTPSTVRTYLRQAYLRLGVKNKVQLGKML